MRCAGSSLIFSRRSLHEALQGVRRLGFSAVEVGTLEGWAHISPVQAHVDREAVRAELETELAASGLSAIAFNAGLRGSLEDQGAQLDALAAIAHAVGARTITIAGARGPGITAEESERLRQLVAIAAEHGVHLAVETHMGTLTEDPLVAALICRDIPGLALTLDPSHYWAGPAQGKGWEVVLPYVSHVHLRDAGFGGGKAIQVAPGKGVVDFAAVVAGLAAARVRPGFSVEYIDTLPVVGGGTVEEAARAMAALSETLLSPRDGCAL